MKLSSTSTGWIIVNASNDSTWDTCAFALVELNQTYVSILKERYGLASSLKDIAYFQNISFWDGPAGWFRYSTEHAEIMEQLSSGALDWSFVELEPNEGSCSFVQVEQSIDLGTLEVFPDGKARFTASGKHSDEHFWTSELDLGKL